MADAPQDEPEEIPVAHSRLAFSVVGIGASAGGVAALQRLLRSMPAGSGMAFVVVTHLSPDHESSLGAILQRATKMLVVTVSDTTAIAPDHVYVVPPALRLVMSDGQLRVFPTQTIEGRRQSIDLFFRSLAQAHRERSFAIVLTGTGSDGAQGIKRVKELGGVVMAQAAADAEFDGMPRAAVLTGVVDFVLAVADIPGKLMEVWNNARQIELPRPPDDLRVVTSKGDEALLAEEALLSIKALLRERTGHDFSHYKRGTVLRRLERRMQVNAVPDLPSYRRLLDSEPRETPALLQDMLISVTNFFRDPIAFEALGAALRSTLPDRPQGEPYRAWVAGCATGEEAYSVAILLRTLLGPQGPPITLFASDIDQRAINAARSGRYADSIAPDLPSGTLDEFFIKDATGYHVTKALRDSVVFSAHNVLSDPPFTRMDLICCRNLLIYLDRSAQTQLLRSFHFALRPRGILFLGTSETADSDAGLFEPVDKAHRVYRASPVATRSRAFPFIAPRPSTLEVAVEPVAAKTAPLPPLEVLHDKVFASVGPPTILVDAHDTVLHVSERASSLLRLAEGAPSNKLMALARPELRAELRAAMMRAAETQCVIEAPRVLLALDGQPRSIVMTVRPAIHVEPPGMMLVVFDDSQESMAPAQSPASTRDPVVEALEAELLRTQGRLHATVGESAASTEELRASNEELQTINEELRSTTEELETSREELQAVNEELTTVNAELTIRIDETGKINDDLHNLMTSAEIGAVFVDREVRVKRFTPQAAKLFNLLPSDEGRPLLDLSHRLDYPELADDIATVVRDLKRVEREVAGPDDAWYLARVAPYRTSEDRIEGAVVALFDVTSRRETEKQLDLSQRHMALVADSMRDYAIVTMDDRGMIATWSRGAEKIFGHSSSEAVGRSFDLIFVEDDIQAGRPQAELSAARKEGRVTDDRWLRRKDGSRVFCTGITTPLGHVGHATGFAKITRDFTETELGGQRREVALARERAVAERAKEAVAMKDQFLAIVSHELKNPLAVVQMNAQLIARMPAAINDARIVASTRGILSAVNSQAQLIDDLLDLSRFNTGKIGLSPAPIELDRLVEDIVGAVRTDAAAKSIELTLHIERSRIVGDPVRVEQIVWNLLTNAIKFTPRGGTASISLVNDSANAIISVADSGIGLESSSLKDIFEMFNQVDAGVARARSGLGIGLALVKQLAELHGGHVLAESEGLGKGARFTVRLPIDAPSAAIAKSPADLRELRLLVVDDEPDMLASFGAVLESEGADVTLASNARQALELARTGTFDAVLSDIGMPGHDGHWLARELRADSRTANLALLAVTGMARESDRVAAHESDFDGLIGKPVDFVALRAAIVQALSMRKRGLSDEN